MNATAGRTQRCWGASLVIGALCVPSLLPLLLWQPSMVVGPVSPAGLALFGVVSRVAGFARPAAAVAMMLTVVVAVRGRTWNVAAAGLVTVTIAAWLAAVNLEPALRTYWCQVWDEAGRALTSCAFTFRWF